MARFHEHISRSLVKSITFRCLVVVSDWIIIFSLTHRYDLTLGVVFFSNFASTFLYFIHERIWNNIHWGKAVKK